MIYHITFPHSPFIQDNLFLFEKTAQNKNKVLLITNKQNENNSCKIENGLLIYRGPLTSEVVNMVNSSDCTGIFIYWLTDELIDLALKINYNKPIYWRSYGPDLHSILYKDDSCFLEKETKQLLNKTQLREAIKNIIRPVYQIFKGKFFKRRLYIKRKLLFLKRIDYIGTVTDYEYEQLKDKVTGFRAQKIMSILVTPKVLPPFTTDAQNIMIGHSSFSYHNHADVFKILQSIGMHQSKLIVPLNYGDKVYAEKVIKLGKTLFNDRFIPLLDYLPIDEYNLIIEKCHSFILNSYVQQGGGNILHFLLTGGKVYLHEKNPIYIDKKKEGFSIFSVQSDLTFDHLYNYQLTDEEKRKNRELLMDMLYSEEKIVADTKKIIEALGA